MFRFLFGLRFLGFLGCWGLGFWGLGFRVLGFKSSVVAAAAKVWTR